MKSRVRKWGNSSAVRIPAAVMAAANLRLDQVVDVRAEDGRVVIAPIRPARPNLAALLAAITPENLHAPIDFDPPAGQEKL